MARQSKPGPKPLYAPKGTHRHITDPGELALVWANYSIAGCYNAAALHGVSQFTAQNLVARVEADPMLLALGRAARDRILDSIELEARELYATAMVALKAKIRAGRGTVVALTNTVVQAARVGGFHVGDAQAREAGKLHAGAHVGLPPALLDTRNTPAAVAAEVAHELATDNAQAPAAEGTPPPEGTAE